MLFDLTKRVDPLESLGFFKVFYKLSPRIATPFRGRRRPQRREEPKCRINERIRAQEVRLVGPEGDMIGVVSVKDAQAKAGEAGLDLVEISPKAVPPVCKIIDYGKYLYELKKKEKQAKKASKVAEVKGVRLSFRIGPGDLERQRAHAEEFLTSGNPVRVQMMLRGREKAHKSLAFEKMKGFTKSLEEFGTVEQPAKFGGSQIIAVLKPLGKK